MKLDALLRAHAFLQVERPPGLWEVDEEDAPLVRVLGEMIAAGLARGSELGQLVLNAANVTVEDDPEEPEAHPGPGDYVALTIRGCGDWRPEIRWWPERPTCPLLVNDDLDLAARAAGVRFGYTRAFPGEGSVTVFFGRK